MARLRPGWLVVLCAAVLAVSAWLPWVTSRADGGGHANALGGIVGNMPVPPPGFGVGQLITLLASTLIVAGAMAARGLSGRLASTAALAISVLLVVLTMWYYRLYVYSPVSPMRRKTRLFLRTRAWPNIGPLFFYARRATC